MQRSWIFESQSSQAPRGVSEACLRTPSIAFRPFLLHRHGYSDNVLFTNNTGLTDSDANQSATSAADEVAPGSPWEAIFSRPRNNHEPSRICPPMFVSQWTGVKSPEYGTLGWRRERGGWRIVRRWCTSLFDVWCQSVFAYSWKLVRPWMFFLCSPILQRSIRDVLWNRRGTRSLRRSTAPDWRLPFVWLRSRNLSKPSAHEASYHSTPGGARIFFDSPERWPSNYWRARNREWSLGWDQAPVRQILDGETQYFYSIAEECA